MLIEKHRLKHGQFLLYLLGAPERGAEVGVERGILSEQLLEALPKLHLVAVDPWWSGPYRDLTGPEARAEFENRVARYRRRVTVIAEPSVLAAEQVENGSLDFVFIDADHAYRSVCEDIEAWRPKVRAGGILAGHDYCDKYPGVIRAVDEAFPHRCVLKRAATWWVDL